jgi:hypothetical protein
MLLSMVIEVVEEDPSDWAPNALGRSSTIKGRISIRKGLPEDILLETVLHEVIHMIADVTAIGIRGDETSVSVLSCALSSFLRDNTQFVERVCRARDLRLSALCPSGEKDLSQAG